MDPLAEVGISRLGRYMIVGLIGDSTQSAVYRARDEVIRRDIAIRLFVADEGLIPCECEDAEDRFMEDAQSWGRLIHPSIAVVHDIGKEDGFCYVAMELLEGTNPRQIINEAPVIWDEALDIVFDVLDTLEYAHGMGVVHKDLKPENVFLLEDGRVKVTDFAIGPAGGYAGSEEKPCTGLECRSPEQLQDEWVGPPTDVFACGVLLHELMSGSKPFEAATAEDVARNTLREELPPLTNLGYGIPEVVDDLIHRATSRVLAARFQTAYEFRSQILGVVASERSGVTFVSASSSTYGNATLDALTGGADAQGCSESGRKRPREGAHLNLRGLKAAVPSPSQGHPWKVVVGFASVILLVLVTLGGLLVSRVAAVNRQKKHYLDGKVALEQGQYDKAAAEFAEARGYEDAEQMAEEAGTRKQEEVKAALDYESARERIGSGDWNGALVLLRGIQEKRPGYRDIAGTIDYIEKCPRNPTRLTLSDLIVSGGTPSVMQISSLAGRRLGSIRLGSDWNYMHAGCPEYISAARVTLNHNVAGSGTVIMGTSDQDKYREDGALFVVPTPGLQLDAPVGNWNFHFEVREAATTDRVPLKDGSYSASAVFSRLVLECNVGVR